MVYHENICVEDLQLLPILITPDPHHSISKVSDSPYLSLDPSQPLPSIPRSLSGTATQKLAKIFAPFQNASTFRLMDWFYRPSLTKSIVEVNALVKNIILAPDFNPKDLVGFDAAEENARMDNYRIDPSDIPTPFSYDDGWLKGSVDIPLPCDGFKFPSEAAAPTFNVEFHYRKITQVIQSALAEQRAEGAFRGRIGTSQTVTSMLPHSPPCPYR